jgi:hypothetical protein
VGSHVTTPAVEERAQRRLVLDRAQRDAMQRLVVDLELGPWAAEGFVLDPPDPVAQQARRARLVCALHILDDLGWQRDDSRTAFELTPRDEQVLAASLLQWRDWQIQAIEDIRRDREAGMPVSRTAPELLRAAERMAVLAALLAQLR